MTLTQAGAGSSLILLCCYCISEELFIPRLCQPIEIYLSSQNSWRVISHIQIKPRLEITFKADSHLKMLWSHGEELKKHTHTRELKLSLGPTVILLGPRIRTRRRSLRPRSLSHQPGFAQEAPHTTWPIAVLSTTSVDRERRRAALECRPRPQMDRRTDEHMQRHTWAPGQPDPWHRSCLGVQLTALSPPGRAPLSSRHSFRYLAETFSLCLPFSKTCFMPGALQTYCSNLPSPPLFLSPWLLVSAHTSTGLASPAFFLKSSDNASYISFSFTLISPHDSSSELRLLHCGTHGGWRCITLSPKCSDTEWRVHEKDLHICNISFSSEEISLETVSFLKYPLILNEAPAACSETVKIICSLFTSMLRHHFF